MSSSNQGYSFVKVRELRDFMNSIGLDADQSAASQDVLDGVQRALERHLQRNVGVREHTEMLWPDAAGRIWPSHTPVVAVVAPADGSVVANGNYLTGFGHFGFGWHQPVSVTYTAGLDPDQLHDVRLAIMRVAAREVTDRHDDVLSVRDTDARRERRTDPRPQGWTPEELAAFDRLRRRTVL